MTDADDYYTEYVISDGTDTEEYMSNNWGYPTNFDIKLNWKQRLHCFWLWITKPLWLIAQHIKRLLGKENIWDEEECQ